VSRVSIDEALGGINTALIGDLTRNTIKESLARAGGIKAMYMEIRKLLPENNFHEKWWFLTELCLVKTEITAESILIRNYLLNNIASVEREYDIASGPGESIQTLKTVRIMFVGRVDDLIITRPFEKDNGDVQNFARLFQLL
jgi:hypothetical protein